MNCPTVARRLPLCSSESSPQVSTEFHSPLQAELSLTLIITVLKHMGFPPPLMGESGNMFPFSRVASFSQKNPPKFNMVQVWKRKSRLCRVVSNTGS